MYLKGLDIYLRCLYIYISGYIYTSGICIYISSVWIYNIYMRCLDHRCLDIDINFFMTNSTNLNLNSRFVIFLLTQSSSTGIFGYKILLYNLHIVQCDRGTKQMSLRIREIPRDPNYLVGTL